MNTGNFVCTQCQIQYCFYTKSLELSCICAAPSRPHARLCFIQPNFSLNLSHLSRVFFSLLDGHLGQSKCRERSLQEVLELCWDRCRLRRRLVQLSRHPHQLVLLLRPIRLQQTRESALYLQLGPVVSLTEIILILLQIPLSEVLRGDRSIRLAAMLQAQHQACY